MVAKRVDGAAPAESGERAVDGREPDAFVPEGERGVDLLGSRVVPFVGKDGEHCKPLACRLQAVALEQLGRLRLRPHDHTAYDTRRMRLRLILISAPLALLAAGCGGGGARHDEIVAAFYPVAFAARHVAPQGTKVVDLTPPGVEPHDLELKPSDVSKLHSAELVLLLGHGFQPEVEDAAGDGNRVVRLLDTPGLHRRDNDPHVWLDPIRYALLVGRIAAALHRPDAARPLLTRLRALDREYRAGLRHCARHQIVTSHEAFAYLGERYGLTQVAITGISPEAEPTPQRLRHVVEVVRSTGATTIFFETLVSPRIAETVARETEAKTGVLDPIEGLTPDEERRGDDYFTVMRGNLRALRTALGCR
jgi:zinc transport system substrate-binding protein